MVLTNLLLVGVDKQVYTLPKGISPKMNGITQLVFELISMLQSSILAMESPSS